MGLAKSPLVFVTVLLLAFMEVNSLKCYVCKNCTKVTSSQLTACVIPPINSTTTTSTTTEASTNSNTTESTSTTANSTDSTPSNANSTDSTPSTANSTDSTPSTANSTDSTPTTANTTESTAGNGTEELTVFRVKRLAETYNEGSECFCDNGYCNCGGEILISPYVDLVGNITVTFVCLKESVTSNSVTTVNRGCGVELNTTANSCRLAGYDQSCKVCKTDGCNSAFMTTFSFFAIIPALLMSVA